MPDIPASVIVYAADFVVIATSTWLPEVEGIEKIRGDLEALLASTVCYPPARALAIRGLEDTDLPWLEFADQFEQRLKKYLTTQPTSGFQLLRCLQNQGDSLEMGGYGGAGHYYWVLAANEETVDWVSDQTYEVHWAHIGEFEVPADHTLPSDLPDAGSSCESLLAQKSTFAKASVRGGEYAWSISEWPGVLAQAELEEMACLNGTFQFRTPLHTAPLFRLNTETSPRAVDEPWPDYCRRARAETMDQIDAILKATDFESESERFRSLSDYLREKDLLAMEFLVFVPTLEQRDITTGI